MKVFVLGFESLDPDCNGILAFYSNRHAAEESLDYAKSLNKYFKLFIEVFIIQENFFKTDFD